MVTCCIIYIKIHFRQEVVILELFIDKAGLKERDINEADSEKLIAMVEFVSQNIKKYTGEKDIDLLRLLKGRCAEKALKVEVARMYRAIGMHNFYRNNMKTALEMLHLAIDLIKEYDRKDLLAAYTSELGLLYFYEHENKKAEMQYEYVEKLLPDIPELDKYILHLHYYRYGILHNILHKFELAQKTFEKALSYAEEKADIGYTLMDIGVNYKRQLDFNKALEYYNKALETFEEDDYLSKSMVCNNLAELYKVTGSYDKALEHINKAFEYLGNKNASKLFVYFTTYTEIVVLLGKPEKALDRFIDMLSKIEDFSIYKSLIIEGIDSLATAGAENGEMLKKLEAVVLKLIKATSAENPEYEKGLKSCLKSIRLYMQEANESHRKGGLFFEKDNY